MFFILMSHDSVSKVKIFKEPFSMYLKQDKVVAKQGLFWFADGHQM